MNSAHRIFFLSAVLLGASACAADVTIEEQTNNVDETPPEDPPYAEPAEGPSSPYATKCEGLGHLDFALSASKLEEHEGRAVWMSAVEPSSTDTATVPIIAAFEQGEVIDGSFDLACEDSLTANFAYPSFTVVIDTDDSGDCSAADLAATFQGYGWADDQVFDLTLGQDEWVPATWHAVGDTPSFWGEDLCTYYFDGVRVDSD